MRAIAIGLLLLTIFVEGYHYQQEHPQPEYVQAASQQAPPKSITLIGEVAATKQQESAYQKTASYLKKAFGPEYFAAWILVLAAGIGLYVTWRTARAAFLNAQAVINAERSWIVVSVESPEPNQFNFRATNVGKTPAKIKSIWSRPITFWRDSELEIPPDEKTGESLLSTPPCLLPSTDSQVILRCNIGELGPGQYVGPDASDRVQNDIQKGFRMLYFYGRIIYSDTLDEKSLHETKWLYWYLPVGEGAAVIPDPRHPELNSYS